MKIRLSVTIAALVAVSLAGACGPSAPTAELPALPDLKDVQFVPQDVASLPRGDTGELYNAIPACDLIDWSTIYRAVGSEFSYADDYNATYEMRGCSSQDGGTSTGQTMVAATRVDRPGPAPLYEALESEEEKNGQYEAYTGYKPSGVQECFWLRDFKDHDINTGMVCRDLNNVTVHFMVIRGISEADSVKAMAVMLGRARAYYEKYYPRHG